MSFDLLTGKQDSCDLSLHIDLDDSIALGDVVPLALDTIVRGSGSVLGPAKIALMAMSQVVKNNAWLW